MSEFWRRVAVPWLGGALLLAGALWLQVANPAFTQRAEAIAYDLRLRASLTPSRDSRVVIVDIDEHSLASEGQWPWPRERLALLVDNLFAAGAAVIAFDVVFSEGDKDVAAAYLRELAHKHGRRDLQALVDKLPVDVGGDAALAKALHGRPVVLGYYFNSGKGKTAVTGELPPSVQFTVDMPIDEIGFLRASGYGANIPVLQRAAAGAGYFIAQPDIDGNLRRMPMLTRYGDRLYASLSLETLRVYAGVPALGADVFDMHLGAGRGIENLRVGKYVIPTDRDAHVFIPYRGREGSFAYASAADVLHARMDASRIKNKIVLIGTTAPGLKDLRATPLQEDYPGVETHANIISAALDTAADTDTAHRHHFRQRPTWVPGADVVLLLVIGVLLVLLLPRLTLVPALVAVTSAAGVLVIINMIMWSQQVVLALAIPLLFIVMLYGFNTLYGYLFEVRTRRALTAMFGQYVPPALVDEMSARAENFGLDGESREMTVLFADIRGFTALAETLSPTELKQLLNRFFTPMTAIIHRHRGTIDKYVGDMIMAFWGAPLHDAEHARHALDAAMAMCAAEAELRTAFAADGLPPIAIGIGLNTGVMNVGNMGSEFRMAYTVIGDAVNLASRIEGLTRVYGAGIIVSETTRSGHDGILFRELDRVRVKGKAHAVTIYEPLAYADTATEAQRSELALYGQALKLYRERAWDLAELQFLNLKATNDAPLYRLYVERIQYFRNSPPPPAWDAVFDFTRK